MYRIHRAVHWVSLDAYIRSLGPAAWFRMDQGVTVTGAGISQVDDLSGNARHLLDPGTTRPIYLPYSGTKYLYLPGVAGNYASTPDSAANSITGDIDIRVRVALDDWTPAAIQLLVSKYATTGNQRSYRFYVNASGNLQFDWSVDGATALQKSSTSATGVSDGAEKFLRVTLDVDNGAGGNDVKFFLSDDGVNWTQLGNTVTTASTTAIYDGTSIVEIGSNAGGLNATAGKIYRAIIKNGIDGTTVVDFNPADASDGASSFSSSATGETWTVNTSGALPAQIVGRASVLFNGTSHYLKCNAFTLNQPTCVLMVVKQVSWTDGERITDGNSIDTGLIQQITSTPRLRIYAGAAVGAIDTLTLGAVGVIAAVFNGASSSVRHNMNAATTGNAGAANMGGFTLGAKADGVGPANIQVYETVIFPIAPSTAQLDRIVAGLMARHGVAG